jgi:hypothetical protein
MASPLQSMNDIVDALSLLLLISPHRALLVHALQIIGKEVMRQPRERQRQQQQQ